MFRRNYSMRYRVEHDLVLRDVNLVVVGTQGLYCVMIFQYWL